MLTLYNTLTRKKEVFSPLSSKMATMYNCGPTVYHYAHIGNLRAFLLADTLRRTLEWNGYEVKQIMNITDVGHLVSDADEGEDKMEKGARREGKSAREIAEFYTNAFFRDIDALNIKRAWKYPKATEHIEEQVALIQELERKGYTYKITDGIYFDTSKFPRYADFARLDLSHERAGVRVEENKEKRGAADFALWKFSAKEEKRQQEWESPWGVGFPGWHIECSAMAMKYLGETIDIHTGGIDHIPVHHTNEIAQSESATEKQFVRFWLHSEFVNIGEDKMAKSGENFITLQTIIDRGIHPLVYRYFVLTAHYRTLLNFSFEALDAARTAFLKLHAVFHEWEELESKENSTLKEKLQNTINDDINTPKVIALLWDITKDNTLSHEEKKWLFLEVDKVLGLGFAMDRDSRERFLPKKDEGIPGNTLSIPVQNLLTERESARKHKDWKRADELRVELFQLGYKVVDGENGQKIQNML
ncbi:cysteine--tRNA ligase [bacterium]|nr:cysteine--tRNA ligase [bacterium]